MRCSWATSVFTCTGLNTPSRIICAIPRASLRSVLLICCAVSNAFMCRVSTQITGSSGSDQPLRQRTGFDPDPAIGHVERGQKGNDIGRFGGYFLLQDHLAGIVDNAHRRFLHRHIKTCEMRHLIAPSPMLEVEPTSIHSSSQKGMRTHRQRPEPQPPRYTICRFG